MKHPSPVLAAMFGRCPSCGEGRLYRGYLNLVETCDVCRARISDAHAEDAPVTFILVLVGGIGMAGIIVSIVKYDLPAWLVLAIWIPLIVAMSLLIMPPFKGALTALQHKHDAGEHRVRHAADGEDEQ